MQLVLRVNGTSYEVEARPTARLLDVLRNQLGLTGTKEGCAEGECGACTVMLDGKAVNSCVVLAVQARGKEIITVEGLAKNGQLDVLQGKFIEHGAVQCGYCTPGMLMSAKALLMANPAPSERDIRTALAGNLCRCTGYSAIVAAVKAASEARDAVTTSEICGVMEPGAEYAAHSAWHQTQSHAWEGTPEIEVLTPSTLEQLATALTKTTPRSRLVAGGTDLVPILLLPGSEPDLLIDLSGLEELKSIHCTAGKLHVGALVTFSQLESASMIREYALCLGLAAAQVGSTQIRNAGTIGGNVANASPCADGVTALTALGAEVTTLDGTGTLRTRPIHEVVLGPNCTDLAHDEAIVEFTFPAYGPDYRSAFAKIGSRTTVSVARVSAALRVRIDAEAGVLSEVYAALGAVGDTAFRATRLEQVLAGRPANEETARIFAEGCVEAVEASIPSRCSLPYKRHAVVGLAYDVWNMLALSPPVEPSLKGQGFQRHTIYP